MEKQPNRGRAYRRHQDARALGRGRRVAALFAVGRLPGWAEGYARKLARTRKPCSCSACGNPRRHFGQPSVQERRLEAVGGPPRA